MQFIRGRGLDEVLGELKQPPPGAKASDCAPTLTDGEARD
jgi:hypothetical protein